MALVVEDGTGLSTAQAYISVADADTYWTARGNTDWTGSTTANKEFYLVKATAYLDRAYRTRWLGYRSNEDQALAWPRTGSDSSRSIRFGTLVTVGIVDEDGYEIDTDVVPQRIKDATCEAADLFRQGIDPLEILTRGGMTKSERVKAGPVESETEYMDGAPGMDRYLTIEGLLRGLVHSLPGSTFGNVALVRG